MIICFWGDDLLIEFLSNCFFDFSQIFRHLSFCSPILQLSAPTFNFFFLITSYFLPLSPCEDCESLSGALKS